MFGTGAAIAAAVASFLLYDALFVVPRFTLAVDDPEEWLDLLLLLFVGIVIGRLAALQTERAQDATRRAGESRALFRISRTLATATSIRAEMERLKARSPETLTMEALTLEEIFIATLQPEGVIA